MTPYALILLLFTAAPDAGKVNLDHCTISAKKGDRVRKGGDVVVTAGEVIEDAMAVEGNVIVKTGASVKNAMALHGSVIVEDGATVRGSVVAVGGKALVSKTAKVGESQVALDDSALHVTADDGHQVEISVGLGGRNLTAAFLKPMLRMVHDCAITATDD